MTKNLFKYTLLSIFALSVFATSNTAFAAAPSCRLTADSGDTVVSFNVSGPLLSNAQPNQTSVNTSVPVGKYNLSAETWDDHAAHGGQNQGLEKVIFIGYDANNTEIFRTGATTDIVESANWAVTNLTQNLNLTSEVKKIVAKHNHIGAGNYQSIYPVCIKFDKVADVIPDPTLNASCVANPTNANLNQNINWKVTPTGGNNSYTYTWSGTDGLSGTTQEVNKSYSTVGTKAATVVVKSGAQEKTVNCSANITTTPPPPSNDLVASCSVSDTSVETDESVTFSSNVSGGKGPYTYKWTGDISSTNSSKTTSFDDEGRYRAYLEVRDSENRVANATCSTVNVDDNNNSDDLDISCEVSDTRVEEGDYVTFSVDIDGGNSPYEIKWKGDISGDDERERVRFNRSGRYEVEVTVEDDDGNRESDTCSTVRVDDEDDEDDDNDINVIGRTNNTPRGNLASVDSVFLSSLPYTGPADTAKTLGFISLLILWSAIITKLLLTKKQKQEVKSRIQAFKEANKANKVA